MNRVGPCKLVLATFPPAVRGLPAMPTLAALHAKCSYAVVAHLELHHDGCSALDEVILRRSKDAPRSPIPRLRHPPACCGARAGTSPEFGTSFGRRTDERVLAGHRDRYRNALSVDSDGLPRTRRDRVPGQRSDRTGADGQLDGLERATDSCPLGSGGRVGHVPIGRICVRLELRDAGLIARLVCAN